MRTLSREELTTRLLQLEKDVEGISARQHEILKMQKRLADADVVHTGLVKDIAEKVLGPIPEVRNGK